MNNNIIIIGGSGGVGSELARRLSDKNNNVHITYFNNEKKAKEIQQLTKCNIIKCDMTKESDIETMIKIVNDKRDISVVINCISSNLKLLLSEKINILDYKKDLETILISSINLYKYVIPIFKKNNSGLFINFITSAVMDPIPTRMSSYIAAKYGLWGFIKSVQSELSAYNIFNINIFPSFIETDLLKPFPSKLLELERNKLKEKRFLKPSELSELVQYIINIRHTCNCDIVIKTYKDIENYKNNKSVVN